MNAQDPDAADDATSDSAGAANTDSAQANGPTAKGAPTVILYVSGLRVDLYQLLAALGILTLCSDQHCPYYGMYHTGGHS